jgi:3-hydroxybutyryl-CoA dehydrogenase
MDAPKVIGVVGAGTMGSGIAQLAAQSGARTLLFDAMEGAAEKGAARRAAWTATPPRSARGWRWRSPMRRSPGPS